MRTLIEFIAEKQEMGSQYYAELDIENTEKLYQAAMRAKNAKDLEKSMMKMTAQFDDAKNIDFKEVNWNDVYKQLNEKAEALAEKTKTSGGSGYIESFNNSKMGEDAFRNFLSSVNEFIDASEEYAEEEGISTKKQKELIIDDILDYINNKLK